MEDATTTPVPPAGSPGADPSAMPPVSGGASGMPADGSSTGGAMPTDPTKPAGDVQPGGMPSTPPSGTPPPPAPPA